MDANVTIFPFTDGLFQVFRPLQSIKRNFFVRNISHLNCLQIYDHVNLILSHHNFFAENGCDALLEVKWPKQRNIYGLNR